MKAAFSAVEQHAGGFVFPADHHSSELEAE
ncbi:hypothetical protein EDC90_100459 [Martelella mediterranea]|uniref:Uncharacterized protein n=1 Tax=Martelella mediterranea TaxID=293089 RepID=A0A4R3NWP4_9HYPH|nr:hypothetical protein EDC90_100459 [Martelella mediterranea]